MSRTIKSISIIQSFNRIKFSHPKKLILTLISAMYEVHKFRNSAILNEDNVIFISLTFNNINTLKVWENLIKET